MTEINFIPIIESQVSSYELLFAHVLISPSPDDSLIEHFVEFMLSKGVTDMFNFSHVISDMPYDHNVVVDNGINFHSIYIPDGHTPSQNNLNTFNEIMNKILSNNINPTILFSLCSGTWKSSNHVGISYDDKIFKKNGKRRHNRFYT